MGLSVGSVAGGGTGNNSTRFMQHGDAMGLKDELSQGLAKREIVFIMDDPKKAGDTWTVNLTVRNRTDIPEGLLDKTSFYKGLKVNVQVDETTGLH